jgi:CubicO group peptidase (beta-lactamase class C family)
MNTEETFEALGNLIREKMAAWLVPGAAVGVWHRGEMLTAGFGITSVENPLPVNDQTLFQIGSITKTLTATAVMRLVEQGKLELGAPVQRYLPGWRVADEAASRQATVGHLLTHMGNWVGDFFHGTGPGTDALRRYAARMADLPQLAPIGTAWSYNNAGFGLLGLLIETVTNQSYTQALRELVTGPLGLENLHFGADDVISRRFAVGHRTEEGRPVVARPWALPRNVDPIGGIVTDVRTMLAYARFHLGDGLAPGGQRLLQPETLARMHRPQVAIRGDRDFMGLSWFITDTGGLRRLHHGGGTKGQISRLMLVPEQDFALAIVTNGEDGTHVTMAASDWALATYLGLTIEEPALMVVSPDDLQEYAGQYRRPYQDIALSVEDGRLVARLTPKAGFPTEDVPPAPPPPPMTCALYEPDQIRVLDTNYEDTLGEFIRRANGQIGWLRFGGRLHPRD